VEFQEYDDMMRRMLAIVVHMESAIDELRTFNRQQVEINARNHPSAHRNAADAPAAGRGRQRLRRVMSRGRGAQCGICRSAGGTAAMTLTDQCCTPISNNRLV
jgi:hypothetical protein